MKLQSDRWFKPIWIVYAVVLVLLYTVFFDSYLNEYLDNAWTLSWAHGWWTDGEVYDQVFGYIKGDGGTSLFSRSFVFVYGGLAQVFGWSRGVGIIISSLFTIGTAALWYRIVRNLGYRKQAAVSFALILLLLEIFYANGHKIRVDAMGLFLDSLALLLFIRHRYLFAGLVLGIAFESHPFAMAAGFWMLAYLWTIRKDVQKDWKIWFGRAGLFFAGLSIGFLYWWLLHHKYLENTGVGERLTGNTLWEYFVVKRYSWRHWPELVMISAGVTVFIVKKSWKKHPFILPFTIASLLVTFIIPRANSHYTAYVYPSFVLLLLVVAEDYTILPWLLAGIFLFQVPQYGWLFWTQKGYNQRKYMAELQARVPEEPKTIYGNPGSWFAFQDRVYRAYGYYERAGIPQEEWPKAFLAIVTKDIVRWGGMHTYSEMIHMYSTSLLDEWTDWEGKPVRLLLHERID